MFIIIICQMSVRTIRIIFNTSCRAWLSSHVFCRILAWESMSVFSFHNLLFSTHNFFNFNHRFVTSCNFFLNLFSFFFFFSLWCTLLTIIVFTCILTLLFCLLTYKHTFIFLLYLCGELFFSFKFMLWYFSLSFFSSCIWFFLPLSVHIIWKILISTKT